MARTHRHAVPPRQARSDHRLPLRPHPPRDQARRGRWCRARPARAPRAPHHHRDQRIRRKSHPNRVRRHRRWRDTHQADRIRCERRHLGRRTCLVLTQRTDHIDAIVGELTNVGVNALVLRGGLDNKARTAVSDAIAARSPDDGIVLVATGSYLGEGFDWPELDTLFLAIPIAFKGRVAVRRPAPAEPRGQAPRRAARLRRHSEPGARPHAHQAPSCIRPPRPRPLEPPPATSQGVSTRQGQGGPF